MKLTRIQAAALKGQTFGHDLADLTIFVGRNNAGKTARADAIRLALLGFLPELGKTNAATFALSSASKMSVEAQIGGRPPVRREWKASGKSVKLTSAGIDDLPETPLVLLSAGEYFAKSDAQRVQMLFDVLRLDAAEWTPAATQKRIEEKAGVIGLDDLPALLASEPDETVQAWLDRIAEDLKAEQAKANADALRFERTAQGITSLSLEEQPVDAQRIAQDMADAERRLGELRTDHGRLMAVSKQQGEVADRQAEVQRAVANITAELGERPLPAETREENGLRLGGLNARRGELQAQHKAAAEAMERANKAELRRAELEVLLKQAAPLADQAPALRGAVAPLEEELAAMPPDQTEEAQKAVAQRAQECTVAKTNAEGNAKRREALLRDIGAMLAKPCCPTCGRKGTEWRKAMEEKRDADLKEIDDEGASLRTSFENCRVLLGETQATYDNALALQRRRQALERQVHEAQMRAAEAAAATRNSLAYQGELQSLKIEAPAVGPTLADDLARLAEQIAQATDDGRRLWLAERLAEAKAELARLSAPGDEDAAERAAMLEDEIEAQEQRIADLKQEQQKAANQAADQKRLAESADEKEKAKARSEALGLVRAAVLEVRAQLIDEAFGPLLDKVNAFTAGILPTPMEYRDGELGRFEGASWVPVRCFGGCHMAVSYAGIQAALGSSAPAKMAIVDELGRFDRENKQRFLNNVLAAIDAGHIDQFIGCDVTADAYTSASKRLKVHQL